VYRFGAGAGAYACRRVGELVGPGDASGGQFLQRAEDVPETVGKGHAEVFVFDGHRDEFLDAAQRRGERRRPLRLSES